MSETRLVSRCRSSQMLCFSTAMKKDQGQRLRLAVNSLSSFSRYSSHTTSIVWMSPREHLRLNVITYPGCWLEFKTLMTEL
jgi:predicted YcjX-like family ATPase